MRFQPYQVTNNDNTWGVPGRRFGRVRVLPTKIWVGGIFKHMAFLGARTLHKRGQSLFLHS